MKNEPCVRLGIFMRPKISEKPADRRNKRPPSVMLLTASTSHRLIAVRFARRARGTAAIPSRFERRGVARGHALRPGPLLVVCPGLAHPRLSLAGGAVRLVALPVAGPDG